MSLPSCRLLTSSACRRWPKGFPLAVLEAMAAGKPVIATPVGGVPEAIVHDESGLLTEPAQPGALTDAIEKLVSSEALRRRLGDAGRARVREQFSVGGFARAVQDVYDDLMRRPGVAQLELEFSDAGVWLARTAP